jgi:hypothetical protein
MGNFQAAPILTNAKHWTPEKGISGSHIASVDQPVRIGIMRPIYRSHKMGSFRLAIKFTTTILTLLQQCFDASAAFPYRPVTNTDCIVELEKWDGINHPWHRGEVHVSSVICVINIYLDCSLKFDTDAQSYPLITLLGNLSQTTESAHSFSDYVNKLYSRNETDAHYRKVHGSIKEELLQS